MTEIPVIRETGSCLQDCCFLLITMKIVTVVGARPQFIKAAAVSRVLRAVPGVQEILLHTGQHYDANMSAVFFKELSIPEPDVNLGAGSGTHAVQTARMLEGIEAVLLEIGRAHV